jgi:hypothetical protein
MDKHFDGMEFFLTTPEQNDNSYEEKRKYLKRRSHDTEEPVNQTKTLADVSLSLVRLISIVNADIYKYNVILL